MKINKDACIGGIFGLVFGIALVITIKINWKFKPENIFNIITAICSIVMTTISFKAYTWARKSFFKEKIIPELLDILNDFANYIADEMYKITENPLNISKTKFNSHLNAYIPRSETIDIKNNINKKILKIEYKILNSGIKKLINSENFKFISSFNLIHDIQLIITGYEKRKIYNNYQNLLETTEELIRETLDSNH